MKKKNWIVLFVVLGTVLTLAVTVRETLDASRRAANVKNMRSINAALKSHASDMSRLPALYVGTPNKRHQSWRSSIQPYLDANQELSIDPLKPWDDPKNASARETSVATFRSPGSSKAELKTRYLAFDAPSSALKPGSRGRKLAEVSARGTRPVPVIIEVPKGEAVHWMEPVEFDLPMLQRLKTKYPNDVFTVLFFDDSTKSLTLDEIKDLFFWGTPQLAAQPKPQ